MDDVSGEQLTQVDDGGPFASPLWLSPSTPLASR